MSSAPTSELALLVDVGSAWTKASAIGRVRDRWRITAHAALPTEWGIEAVEATLAAQLASTADRRVRRRLGEIFRSAVRIECHTARRPARLAIMAVSRDLSGSAARRAAESAGWQVALHTTMDDGRALAERLGALQDTDVDAWLLAGGFDDGRSQLALEAAALVAAARAPGGGPVIWAGSQRLSGEVTALFEDGAVRWVANPRPDPRHEVPDPLRQHLEQLLQETVEPGSPHQLAPIAFRRGVAALAGVSGLRVTGIDLGARYATRVDATPDGVVESRVFADGGLAGAAEGGIGSGRIARGLGHAIDEAAVADVLRNIHARPSTLPHTEDELAVTLAAARSQLSAMTEDAPVTGVDLLIGAGRVLAAAQHPGQSVQAMLDGIRPLGVTQLAVDAAGVLGPLGALPDDEIVEGITLLGDDVLVSLGTAVVCRGGEPGQVAMRVTLHRAGWPDPAPIEVRSGGVQVLALERGTAAELVIEPADGVSLGAPRRASRIHAEAIGGALGLIVDARGVPLALPRRNEDRQAVLSSWRETLLRGPSTEHLW